MIASMQININHCRVWLFYNEMGAVAQCPNNWGVGSAFHPKKIHICTGFILCFGGGVLVSTIFIHMLSEVEHPVWLRSQINCSTLFILDELSSKYFQSVTEDKNVCGAIFQQLATLVLFR